MVSVGATNPTFIVQQQRKADIQLHADSGNTDLVKVSWSDPSVSNYEELAANESAFLYDFSGAVYALSKSGTQKLVYQITGASDGVVIKP